MWISRILRKKLHFSFFVLLILLPFFLTGCWDRQEIEERTAVVAIGVDRIKKDKDLLLRVTVQIPITNQIASGGGGGGGGGKSGSEAVRVMSSTGKTFIEAIDNLQKRVHQQLFYGHTRVIAFGEETARSGVESIVDGLRRDPQIRRLLWPIVVKGEALDLLKANPKLEQIPTVFLMSMIETGTKLERIPDITLGKFYISLSNTAEQPCLTYVETHENDVKIKGLAVFREDRMVGSLNDKETGSWIQVKEDKFGGNITFPMDENKNHLVTFHPHVINRKYQFAKENGKVNIAIPIKIEGDIIESTFAADFSKPSTIRKLEKRIAEVYEKQAHLMIRKMQEKYKSDTLGLGRELRAFHYDIWKSLDWNKAFLEADIHVNYKVKLRRTGMEMR